MDDADSEWLYHAISVWPGPAHAVHFDVREEFDKQEPPDFVRIFRGTDNRVLSEMQPLDLPLP